MCRMLLPTNFLMKQKTKLEVQHLSKAYQIPIFQDISLHVLPNEIVSVIGTSGCGKSTLLDCIAGIVMPDLGDIIFDGKSTIGKVGTASYMMQDDALFPWRNVLDNIMLPLELKGKSSADERQKTKILLQRFGLSDFASYSPFQLSAGMRQRVALLRAYLCEKEMMLMDEPFSKLDALTRFHLQKWFLEIWQARKLSVLLVTHDIDEALLLSDRIYVLSPRPAKVKIQIKVQKPRLNLHQKQVSRKQIKTKNEIIRLLQA